MASETTLAALDPREAARGLALAMRAGLASPSDPATHGRAVGLLARLAAEAETSLDLAATRVSLGLADLSASPSDALRVALSAARTLDRATSRLAAGKALAEAMAAHGSPVKGWT